MTKTQTLCASAHFVQIAFNIYTVITIVRRRAIRKLDMYEKLA